MGSGGIAGKGWLNGTQTHLEFIPERSTDFIFAVYSEEFGLLGNLVLLVLYAAAHLRAGSSIAAQAPTLFTRLLAGAMTLIFFTYAFVNMGMVSGILPVVGVPLPFGQLRRHRARDPLHRHRHPDVRLPPPEARPDLGRDSQVQVRVRFLRSSKYLKPLTAS